MQGRSKCGVLLQSVLFDLKSQFDFDKCKEGLPDAVRWSRVPGNLPRLRTRMSRFEVFLGDGLPCMNVLGQLRRTDP